MQTDKWISYPLGSFRFDLKWWNGLKLLVFLIFFSVVLCRFLGRRTKRRIIAFIEKKRWSNRMPEERVMGKEAFCHREAPAWDVRPRPENSATVRPRPEMWGPGLSCEAPAWALSGILARFDRFWSVWRPVHWVSTRKTWGTKNITWKHSKEHVTATEKIKIEFHSFYFCNSSK